jgi:serine protease Do
MNSLFGRMRASRLISTFTILATLTAGILIGSVIAHGVKGQEKKAVDSSDATPLKVPNPVVLSSTFATIAKEVGPAVVNINTESLPKENPRGRRPMQPNGPQMNGPDDQGGDDDQGQAGPGNGGGGGGDDQGSMQDFFNRFFGGQGGGQQMNPFGGGPDQGPRESLGSGFIVDPRGYILTNNHVVDKADRIFVKLANDPAGDQGRPAKVVGVDKSTDIAVIKIDTKEPLPTIKMGNSDAAQVGDWVLAVGSPFGLEHTVTAGIVSSKNRDIGGDASSQYQRFIQTDAAINPGNSGGPLVNMAGEVIGINTAIYTQSMGYEGVGFAMPSNTVVSVYNDLIGPNHKVTRGWIGISFQPQISSAVAREYGFKNGVLISAVDAGGPADKAGLKADDVIVFVDGHPIKDGDDLVSIISAHKPGESVKVGYLRNGKPESTVLVVGDRDKGLAARTTPGAGGNNGGNDNQNASSGKLGIGIRTVPPNVATRLGIKGGIQIMSVKPGSFADEIGLAQGWIITEVNRKPVTGDEDFKSMIDSLKSGDDVVFVVRNPQSQNGGNSYIGGTLP